MVYVIWFSIVMLSWKNTKLKKPQIVVFQFVRLDLFLCEHLNCLFRNGTSMISLILPPKDAVSRVQKMLAEEYGTATNIKSRVNRLSVLGAITSVQARLKLYNKGVLCLPVGLLF